MLETRVSDSYVTPGFGGYNIDSPVTTIYDPMGSNTGIPEFEFPNRLPGAVVDGLTMYFGPLGDFKPLGDDAFIIPYGNLTGLGGDVHDTFNYTPNGNLYNGHTTIRTPGGFDSHHDW